MGVGLARVCRGHSLTYASDTTRLSTSTSFEAFFALAIADFSTFSTLGAMRLFTACSVRIAEPAFCPRIKSTTSRAFCGETRTYLASALDSIVKNPMLDVGFWMLVEGGAMRQGFFLNQHPTSKIQHLSSLRRLGRLLGRRLHRMPLECAGRPKFPQLLPHHILGDVHRDEFLAVVARHPLPHEIRHNPPPPRPA